MESVDRFEGKRLQRNVTSPIQADIGQTASRQVGSIVCEIHGK